MDGDRAGGQRDLGSLLALPALGARLAPCAYQGRRPSEVGLRVAAMADPATPGRQVMALLLPAPVVTQANLQDVVDAGLVTRSALCRGVAERCATLGLT